MYFTTAWCQISSSGPFFPCCTPPSVRPHGATHLWHGTTRPRKSFSFFSNSCTRPSSAGGFLTWLSPLHVGSNAVHTRGPNKKLHPESPMLWRSFPQPSMKTPLSVLFCFVICSTALPLGRSPHRQLRLRHGQLLHRSHSRH